MQIPDEIARELSVITQTNAYKALRAYWYIRLSEVAWQLTAAPEGQIEILQGQANELKLQIQQITAIAIKRTSSDKIYDDESNKTKEDMENLGKELRSQNATMEAEVKGNVVDKMKKSMEE